VKTSTIYELCSEDVIPNASYLIQGEVPASSSPPSIFTVRDSSGQVYQHITPNEPNPERDMVFLSELRFAPVFPPSLRVQVEVDIPNPNATREGFLRIHFQGADYRAVRPNINGVDIRCLQFPEPEKLRLNDLDVTDRGTQYFLTQMIEYAYRDHQNAEKSARRIFGNGIQFADEPVSDFFGSGTVAIGEGENCLLVIPGTTTAGQGIIQGQGMLAGPQEVTGQWGKTMVAWWQGSLLARLIMRRACPGVRRLTIAGHSMGAAIGTIISENLSRTEGIGCSLFTIGCPRPGDAALCDSVKRRVKLAQFANVGDPVPYTMPSPRELGAAASAAVRAAVGENWTLWDDCGFWSFLRPGGQVLKGQFPYMSAETLNANVSQWLIGRPGISIEAHFTPTYLRYLEQCLLAGT